MTQETREVKVANLLLFNEKNNVIADKLLSYLLVFIKLQV